MTCVYVWLGGEMIEFVFYQSWRNIGKWDICLCFDCGGVGGAGGCSGCADSSRVYEGGVVLCLCVL